MLTTKIIPVSAIVLLVLIPVAIYNEVKNALFEHEIKEFMVAGGSEAAEQRYDMCVRVANIEKKLGIDSHKNCDVMHGDNK